MAGSSRKRSRSRSGEGSRIKAASRFAVLGAGSWGTALAIQFVRGGHAAVLWGRDGAHVERWRAPGATTATCLTSLSRTAHVTADLEPPSRESDDALSSCRATALRVLLEALAQLPVKRLAWATKGFELETGLLPYQVVADVLSTSLPTAVLSGPTFAREVGAGLPSAMTIASSNEQNYAQRLAESISTDTFRAYTSRTLPASRSAGPQRTFSRSAPASPTAWVTARTRGSP